MACGAARTGAGDSFQYGIQARPTRSVAGVEPPARVTHQTHSVHATRHPGGVRRPVDAEHVLDSREALSFRRYSFVSRCIGEAVWREGTEG